MTYPAIASGINVTLTKEPIVTQSLTRIPTVDLDINRKQLDLINPAPYRTGWRTNRFLNPSIEVNTTSYTAGTSVTLNSTTSEFVFGSASLQMTNTGATANRVFNALGPLTAPNLNRFPCAEGENLNYSVYAKLMAGTSTLAVLWTYYNSAGATVSSGSMNLLGLAPAPLGVWARGQRTTTVPTGTGIVAHSVQFRWSSMVAGATSYFDGFLLEKSATVQPYFDGSFNQLAEDLEPVSSWAGTPNNSVSNLTYEQTGTLTISEVVLE